MKIKVTARGDPDAIPVVRVFDYDDDIFAASAEAAMRVLAGGRPINIDLALLLLSARVVGSMKDGQGQEETCRNVSTLLRAEQVMIGVPEMMRSLSFDVCMDGTIKIVVNKPIPIPDSFTSDLVDVSSNRQ